MPINWGDWITFANPATAAIVACAGVVAHARPAHCESVAGWNIRLYARRGDKTGTELRALFLKTGLARHSDSIFRLRGRVGVCIRRRETPPGGITAGVAWGRP